MTATTLINMRELSRRTGKSVHTLRAWRRTWLPDQPPAARRGPRPVPTSTGAIAYVEAEVEQWLAGEIAGGR